MTQINLPTYEQQQEILEKMENTGGFFEKILTDIASGVQYVSAVYGDDIVNVYKTALEIEGEGVLYELYCYSSSTTSGTRTHSVRITIDDNPPIILINRGITSNNHYGFLFNPPLMKDYITETKANSIITGNSYSAATGFNSSNFIGSLIMPVDFRYLKIEQLGSDQYIRQSRVEAYYKLRG